MSVNSAAESRLILATDLRGGVAIDLAFERDFRADFKSDDQAGDRAA